jgi:hypothetical protein
MLPRRTLPAIALFLFALSLILAAVTLYEWANGKTTESLTAAVALATTLVALAAVLAIIQNAQLITQNTELVEAVEVV